MKKPLNSKIFPQLADNPKPWAGLVTSLHKEHDYVCEVEGTLPPQIQGTLYKLGPGLYDRGGERKRMVLDGDGMMQSFRFDGKKVHYRNRFIETKKYLKENELGRFVYPTLSTHSSGSWFENLGITLPHQANITPLLLNNRLLAFDESQRPYELDPNTLETFSETDLDQLNPSYRYWAHYKTDPKNQCVHSIAIEQGPVLKVHIVSINDDFKVINRTHLRLPRASYFHDWFISEDYFGFVLHPAIVSLKTLLKVGLGFDTFSDALKWAPEKGNMIFLYNRKTGEEHILEAPSCWMWHSVNAFQDKDKLFVDFIGSETGGGLGDANSPLFQIMKNDDVLASDETVNHLRRYEIDVKNDSISYSTLAEHGNFELPTVGQSVRGLSYEHAYFIYAQPGEFFARGLGQWDQRAEEFSSYVSQRNEYFSEPLEFDSAIKKTGFLSCLVYDGDQKKSYLGIYKAGALADGPVAKVWLTHHTPLGFHGHWAQAN
jgi:all-trans-8'-apo-beta-carotenal 15,15'-oxygenase